MYCKTRKGGLTGVDTQEQGLGVFLIDFLAGAARRVSKKLAVGSFFMSEGDTDIWTTRPTFLPYLWLAFSSKQFEFFININKCWPSSVCGIRHYKGVERLGLSWTWRRRKNCKIVFCLLAVSPKDILQKSLDIGMDGCGETQSFIQQCFFRADCNVYHRNVGKCLSSVTHWAPFYKQ